MSEILQVLREEHANTASLVKTLEWQVSEFERGKQPDYDVIRATLDYFLSFPDLYHHPKEDLIYGRLRTCAPEIADAIGDLRREHEKLAARSREFAAGLRAVLDEAQVPREAFIRWARGFIDLQWQHMEMEELAFFPAAEEKLSADDWAELNAQMTKEDDPLFGEHVGEKFERLRQKILKWQAQDEAASGR